jgi:hypothetical protein
LSTVYPWLYFDKSYARFYGKSGIENQRFHDIPVDGACPRAEKKPGPVVGFHIYYEGRPRLSVVEFKDEMNMIPFHISPYEEFSVKAVLMDRYWFWNQKIGHGVFPPGKFMGNLYKKDCKKNGEYA